MRLAALISQSTLVPGAAQASRSSGGSPERAPFLEPHCLLQHATYAAEQTGIAGTRGRSGEPPELRLA